MAHDMLHCLCVLHLSHRSCALYPVSLLLAFAPQPRLPEYDPLNVIIARLTHICILPQPFKTYLAPKLEQVEKETWEQNEFDRTHRPL